MDPHLPFLRAIAANPADDLPRLVYADFLEETDEPHHIARAHFIRTQIALETLHPRTREFREAKALERQLQEAFEHAWRFDLPEYLRADGRVTWRRGFPDAIRVGYGIWDDWGRELNPDWFDLHPIRVVHVERLWGQGATGWTTRLSWRRVTGLKLGPRVEVLADPGGNPGPAFAELMRAPVFTALRTLDLSLNQMSDAWLVHFVSAFPGASFASTLEELDLSNCHTVTDAGANTLATTRSLDRLKVLRLVGVPLSGAAVVMLRRRFGERLVVG